MAEKRYYWLKVSEEFFTDKVIKKIRKIAGGDTYALIALRLLLMATKSDFKLYYEGVEDSFAAELALELDEQEDNVAVVLDLLVRCGWIVSVNSSEMTVPKAEEMCGSETQAAARMRKMRERNAVKQVTEAPAEDEASQRYAPVTDGYKNVTTDIEIEIEKDIELQEDSFHSSSSPEPAEEPVFLELPILGGKTVRVTESYCEQMQDLYEAIDVRAEIRKAKAWLLNNPKNAKKDWRRFLGNWLSRAQDKAGRKSGGTSAKTSNENFTGMASGRVKL